MAELKKSENQMYQYEQPILQVKAIMELLEVCLRTTCSQVDNKFFQQKDDMAIGSSLSLIISNIFMEHFEKLALDTAQYQLLQCHVDDTFVVWSHGPFRLPNFPSVFFPYSLLWKYNQIA
jgi:hypothetical protein